MQLFSALAVLAGAVSQVAGAAVATAVLSPDVAIENTNRTVASDWPSGDMNVFEHKNFKGARRIFSWDPGAPGYHHFGTCLDMSKFQWTDDTRSLSNAITSYKILARYCCYFYRDNNCDEGQSMFRAYQREDWWLRGSHNDAINSIKCVENCPSPH